MTKKKQKLELTWIGKEKRPRLEPRILLEDKALSYRAAEPVTDKDIHDNILIHGDKLPIIKRYLTEVRNGVAPRTWWSADEVGTNQLAKRDHLNKLLTEIEPFSTQNQKGLFRELFILQQIHMI